MGWVGVVGAHFSEAEEEEEELNLLAINQKLCRRPLRNSLLLRPPLISFPPPPPPKLFPSPLPPPSPQFGVLRKPHRQMATGVEDSLPPDTVRVLL